MVSGEESDLSSSPGVVGEHESSPDDPVDEHFEA